MAINFSTRHTSYTVIIITVMQSNVLYVHSILVSKKAFILLPTYFDSQLYTFNSLNNAPYSLEYLCFIEFSIYTILRTCTTPIYAKTLIHILQAFSKCQSLHYISARIVYVS
jgi:hypothetical protein